jgi:hypothetical protein
MADRSQTRRQTLIYLILSPLFVRACVYYKTKSFHQTTFGGRLRSTLRGPRVQSVRCSTPTTTLLLCTVHFCFAITFISKRCFCIKFFARKGTFQNSHHHAWLLLVNPEINSLSQAEASHGQHFRIQLREKKYEQLTYYDYIHI